MSLVFAWLVAFALAPSAHAEAASGNASGKHPNIQQAETIGPPQPALWKVVNSKSTIYLLGSIHVLPINFSWHAPAIDQAIGAADVFVFEANLDFGTAEFHYFMDNFGYLPRGQTLHAMLSPEARKQYVTLIQDMHLDPNRLDYLRPGLASLILENAYMATHTSLKLGPGVDASLVKYAKNHNKELRYLESLQSQFEVLIAIGGGSEIKVLEKKLTDPGKSNEEPQGLFAAWAKGDVPKLAAIANEDPSQRAVMLDNRNKTWLPKIESMLKDPKTYLVTVGAAHLAGSNSVISLLCAKGWKVERVQTGPTPPPPACGT
ncbi:MAG TPA: TraB/GumN family protein [Micropepsaceae bacterium]|nr:TraB/GumN family protein [Micropepsaceae bacterium]